METSNARDLFAELVRVHGSNRPLYVADFETDDGYEFCVNAAATCIFAVGVQMSLAVVMSRLKAMSELNAIDMLFLDLKLTTNSSESIQTWKWQEPTFAMFIPGRLRESADVRLDENVVFYDETKSGFSLIERYSYKNIVYDKNVGRLDINVEVKNNYEPNYIKRRSDLKGVELNAGVLHSLGVTNLSLDPVTGGVIGLGGWLQDVMEELAALMNISQRAILPPDGKWGRKLNGSWNGMIRMLIV